MSVGHLAHSLRHLADRSTKPWDPSEPLATRGRALASRRLLPSGYPTKLTRCACRLLICLADFRAKDCSTRFTGHSRRLGISRKDRIVSGDHCRGRRTHTLEPEPTYQLGNSKVESGRSTCDVRSSNRCRGARPTLVLLVGRGAVGGYHHRPVLTRPRHCP